MGNSWGNVPSNTVNLYLHPEVTPSPEEEPTFDPLLGFSNGRKTRGKSWQYVLKTLNIYLRKWYVCMLWQVKPWVKILYIRYFYIPVIFSSAIDK